MFNIVPVTSPIQLDCGPTCLKMLLSYYNIEVELNKLIEDCNITTIGCSGADLLRTGRKYNLDMTAYRMNTNEVIQQDRPAIIWWKYNHWCIMCGINNKGQVVICNPDLGRFSLSIDAFNKLYSGVALFNGKPRSINELTENYFNENIPEQEYFES